jgi:chemotaxis protein methyltransferase CheR
MVPAMISDREFALFQELIRREAGIYLAPTKKSLVVGRLNRRLQELGLRSFREYYDLMVHGGDEEEVVRMLDRICTNETSFFRDRRHFEFLDSQVFPQWAAEAADGTRSKTLRVWSAGCSTGEEPYSLGMMLLSHFPASKGWEVNILATDLSTRVLDRAAAGVWALERGEAIPPDYLKRFMLRGIGSQTERMKACQELRALMRFRRLNLNADHYRVSGRFDLIFLRNVMIYFDVDTKKRVVDHLVDYLIPSGYIFTGLAETLNGITCRVNGITCRANGIIPGVYTPAPRAHRVSCTASTRRASGSFRGGSSKGRPVRGALWESDRQMSSR